MNTRRIIAGIAACMIVCGAVSPTVGETIARPVTAAAAEVSLDLLEYENCGDHIRITSCSRDAEGKLVIPDIIDGLPVTDIMAGAFADCTKLTAVEIPDSVTRILNNAFIGCTALSEVRLPNNLHFIMGRTFAECTSLKEITIPDSVISIWEEAFADSGLRSITLHHRNDSYITLEDRVFAGCKELTSVDLFCVISMGVEVFKDCAALSDVKYTGHRNVIPESTFYNCTSLTSFEIPDNVNTIEDSAFAFSGLKFITIPEEVTEIGKRAFECPYLMNVVIESDSCTLDRSSICNDSNWGSSLHDPEFHGIIWGNEDSSAQKYAERSGYDFKVIPETPDSSSDFLFKVCDDHAELISAKKYVSGDVEIPSEYEDKPVTVIGEGAFLGRKNLKSVTIPDTVTEIGNSAFYGCPKIKAVELPNSIVSIGKYAFGGCAQLEKVNIPAGVEQLTGTFCGSDSLFAVELNNGLSVIGDRTFTGCTALSSLRLPVTVTKIGTVAFACSGIRNIVIPAAVSEIGQGAFYLCPDLFGVTIEGENCKILGEENTILNYIHDPSTSEFKPTFNGVIYGIKGSEAQKYAEKYGYKFSELLAMGDVNCDGKVTIADAAAILQYLGNGDKYPLSPEGRRMADVDGTNGITTADAVFIQRLLSGGGNAEISEL